MTDYTIDEKEYKGFTIKIWSDEYAEDPREWGNCATFVCEHRNYSLGDEHDIDSAVNDLFDKYATPDAIITYFVKERGAKIIDDEGKKYEYTIRHSWGDCTYHIDAEQHVDCIAAEMAEYFSTMEKLELAAASGKFVWLPISIYDHSGISIWLGGTAGHVDARWDCSTIGFAYVEECTAEENRIPDDKYKTWQDWAYHIMQVEMKVYNHYVSGECYGWTAYDEDENAIESRSGYLGRDNIEDIFKDAQVEIDAEIENREKKYREHISAIHGYLEKNMFVGERFSFSGSLWRVGTDMFGQAIIEKARVVKNRVMPYEHFNTSLLERGDAETLYNCLERLKTA